MTLDFTTANGVAYLTLDRPERLNAIDRATIRAVGAAMDEIEADDGVGAVVISGAGRAFSAGMDLKDDAAASPEA